MFPTWLVSAGGERSFNDARLLTTRAKSREVVPAQPVDATPYDKLI